MRKINWCLIALSAVYFAEGIITIIQPYGERTIFLAVANSFTLAMIMAIIGLRK
jgi:hypothetical protein